jgi:hypothetical protein
MSLQIGRTAPATVFDLLGRDENSATFALGWGLEKSQCLRKLLIADLAGIALNDEHEFAIDLQRHGEDRGYTDVEIRVATLCHFIIEAKRHWVLPQQAQLARYAGRLKLNPTKKCEIISISAATREYATRNQSASVNNIPLLHRSWRDIRELAQRAYATTSRFEEKMWLNELVTHIKEYEYMDRISDNRVFVVALSAEKMPECESTWIDVVTRDRRYFHPVGNRWPVEPPNYIAFRYSGQLQSVHHIESYDVTSDVSLVNKEWLSTDTGDHFVYKLGPAMQPPKAVKTGNLYRNARVSCAIDTLLSGAFSTISDARDETNRRLNQ